MVHSYKRKSNTNSVLFFSPLFYNTDSEYHISREEFDHYFPSTDGIPNAIYEINCISHVDSIWRESKEGDDDDDGMMGEK